MEYALKLRPKYTDAYHALGLLEIKLDHRMTLYRCLTPRWRSTRSTGVPSTRKKLREIE